MVLVFKDTSITYPHGMEPNIQGLGDALEILHRWLVLILQMWIQSWNERVVGSEIPILQNGNLASHKEVLKIVQELPMLQHLLVIVQKIFSLEILEVAAWWSWWRDSPWYVGNTKSANIPKFNWGEDLLSSVDLLLNWIWVCWLAAKTRTINFWFPRWCHLLLWCKVKIAWCWKR